MSSLPKKLYTLEEYLALEEASEMKHEFYRGEIFAMSGGSLAHTLIEGNLFAELHRQLMGRDCRANHSNVRLKVEATGLYTYPDVSVACKPFHYENHRLITVLNPRVVCEVLSPSTKAYDLGTKFEHYQQIASLQDILFLSQNKPRIDHYVRQSGGQWLLTVWSGMDAVVELSSIQCRIPMSLIYNEVEFEDEPIN